MGFFSLQWFEAGHPRQIELVTCNPDPESMVFGPESLKDLNSAPLRAATLAILYPSKRTEPGAKCME